MSKRFKYKGHIENRFVPLLVNTMKSKAWRTMSPYACKLYIALKARYSFKLKNNGRIYLSARTAAEETGLNRKTVARAFHELVHYGLIVMSEPGCLGVNGRGKGWCPAEWCNSGVAVVIAGGHGRCCQVATAGNLTIGSSLKGAIVSRLM